MSQPEQWNYEQALTRLKTVVEQLERGSLGLEESLTLFEEGMSLSRICDEKLTEVEARVRVLVGLGENPSTRNDLDMEFVSVEGDGEFDNR